MFTTIILGAGKSTRMKANKSKLLFDIAGKPIIEHIVDSVQKCKSNENEEGFLKQTFFGFDLKKTMKFLNGPFSNMIFKIIEVQKSKIQILLDGKKTTIRKNNYLLELQSAQTKRTLIELNL